MAPVTSVWFSCTPLYVLPVVGAFPEPPAGIQPGSIASGQRFGQGSEAVGMLELIWLQPSAHLGTAFGIQHPYPVSPRVRGDYFHGFSFR